MDKLTAIKIKYNDGTYSDEIPISALAENVEWDSTHTLVDVLGSIDVDVTGTIQDQISQLFNEKISATQLQNYVASQLNEDVSTWLNNNVDPVGSAVIVDSSLTISGAAADAKKTGDLKSALDLSTILNATFSNAGSASPTNKVNYFPISLTAGDRIRLSFTSNTSDVTYRLQLRTEQNLNTSSLVLQLHLGTDNVDRVIYVTPEMTTASYLCVWAVSTASAFETTINITKSIYGTVKKNDSATDALGLFVQSGLTLYDPARFVRGGMNSLYVMATNNSNQIVSSALMTTDGETTVTCKSGFILYIFYSTDGGVTESGTGWVSTFVIPNNAVYRISIRRSTGINAELADIDAFVNCVTIQCGIANAIKNIDNYLSHSNMLPDYYYADNWLQNHIDAINNASAFLNGIVFQFITDLHFGANAQNSKALLKAVQEQTSCSLVVCGGDYALAYGSEAQLKNSYDALLDYEGYIGHDQFYAMCGNHDFYTQVSESDSTKHKYTWGKTYNGIFRASEKWHVSNQMGGYYCIDDDVTKSRLILLNSCEPSTISESAEVDGLIRVRPNQIIWLAERLNEVSNYKIVVFSHVASDASMPSYVANMANVQKILEAFANKTSVTIEFSTSYSRTFDFSTSTSDLICHISGHTHSDASNVSNGVLSIATTCDAYYTNDGFNAQVGTVSEQAFDVFCIDYDAHTISAVRVGRGQDRNWSY